MAKYDLVGNMPTENLISFFVSKGLEIDIDQNLLLKVVKKMSIYFP